MITAVSGNVPRSLLLEWAAAREAATMTDQADAGAILRQSVPDPIAILQAHPEAVIQAWSRGTQFGRKRERGRAQLEFLVAAGVIGPTPMGPRRKKGW